MADDLTNAGDDRAKDADSPVYPPPASPPVVASTDAPIRPEHPVSPAAPAREPWRLGLLLPSVLLVAAVWVPLQLWGLAAAPFHTKGEPREALMVQSIVRDHQWILPRRNAVELPAKPPLFHWLGAAASFVSGHVDESTVRLPSAICSLVAALIVLATGYTVWGPVAGLTAALSLLTSFEWLRAATGARVDMTLTLGLTASLCGLLVLHAKDGRDGRLARNGVWIGGAWAVLSKGPVGLALPLLLILAMTLVNRSLDLVRSVRPLRALLLVGVLAAIWYGFAFADAGADFFRKQILTENVWRFVGTSHFTEGHRHSVLYLFAVLLAGCLPWTIFFPSIGAALWRTRRMIGRHDPQTFLLLWIVVVFAFYAVASSKRGVYLLALYPALFLLLGWSIDTARRNVVGIPALARMVPPIAWLMAWLCGAIAIFATLTRIGLPVLDALPHLLAARAGRDARSIAYAIGTDPVTTIVLFGTAACMAACGALVASRQRWGLLLVCLVIATSGVAIAVRRVVMPAIATGMTRRPFVDTVRRMTAQDGGLAAYRSFDYGFVYYWGANVAMQDDPLSPSGPSVLVAGDDQWARATPIARRLFERVPFIESPRGNNTGRLIVLQRRAAASPASAPPS